MLKIMAFVVHLSLILLIFLRIPEEIMGLANFTTKSNLLGSPASTQRILQRVTAFGILMYFGMAFQLDLSTN